MEPGVLEQIVNLGIAGIMFFMLGVVWKAFIEQILARIKHLEDQNRILLTQVVQQNFRASPAIAPIPPWTSRTPTTLEKELETQI